VHKDFAFHDGKDLVEFRTEVFNIPNTPNFTTPDITYEDSTFSSLLNTNHIPREIQFSLDLKF
jgi:hypothetical protein